MPTACSTLPANPTGGRHMEEANISPAPDKPNHLLVIGATFLLLINTYLSWSSGLADSKGNVAAALGAALVPPTVVLVAYGVARAMGKGRTRSAQARIAFWAM